MPGGNRRSDQHPGTGGATDTGTPGTGGVAGTRERAERPG